jgi:hypothetical protein
MQDHHAAESNPGVDRRKSRTRWLAAVMWATFGVGLLVQTVSPGLTIKHNKLIVPGAFSEGKEIRPAEIIARERRMQLLSAILTVAGALGLAVCYGPALLRRHES